MADFRPEDYQEFSGVDCTQALQKAIDQASLAKGRVVLQNAQYNVGSIFLKSNIELYISPGSTLIASTDITRYFNQSPVNDESNSDVGNPVTRKPSFAFIFGRDLENVSITGGGEINGSCMAFVYRKNKYYCTGAFYPRPVMLLLENVKNLRIQDVILKDSPFWTVHMMGCRNVLISNITIDNPLDVANCDGIDPDHCQDVRILGCNISCADDCICLKNTKGSEQYEPTKDIIVSDCILRSSSAAIKIGTEGVDDFSNVIVSDTIIRDSNRGISIQIRDPGNVHDVFFHHILIQTKLFSDEFWGKAEPIAITSYNRNQETQSGCISAIRFSDINITSENGILIASDTAKIDDIEFSNTNMTLYHESPFNYNAYDLRPGWAQGESLKSDGECVKIASEGKFLFKNFKYRSKGGKWKDYD